MPVRFDRSALPQHRSTKFVLVFLVVGAITAAAFTARAWWSQLISVVKQNVAARQRLDTGIETEVIKITSRGFEPSVIKRSQGPVLLYVDDQTGFWEVALRLDRVTGGRLREIKIHRSKRFWAELFDLNPGQYVLSEANYPGWICRITITAR
jgi:hypothetical protein